MGSTMRRSGLCALACLAGFGSPVRAQQDPAAVPVGRFETIHLMTVAPAQVAALAAALNDFNRVFTAQGCSSCAYRLSRIYSAVDGRPDTLVRAAWPGRAIYVKIHDSQAFAAAERRNPVFSQLSETEIYGRFVEVTPLRSVPAPARSTRRQPSQHLAHAGVGAGAAQRPVADAGQRHRAGAQAVGGERGGLGAVHAV